MPAAGGDINRLAEVTLAVKQTDQDIGAVDHGIDVEGRINPAGTADIEAIFLIRQRPGNLPIVRILVVPTDNVRHALVVAALGRNGLEGLGADGLDIVADESEGIHVGHIDTTVPAVTIIHDMADLVGEIGGFIGHAGRHDARIIGFNLEVDVISMGIVFPMPGLRRHDAVQDVVARGLVGMPERISRMRKSIGKRLDRSIQPLLVEDIYERQVHVDIVIQTRGVVIIPLDSVLVPLDRDVVVDRGGILEFGRSAVSAADDLAGPCSLDLVHQDIFGKSDRFRVLALGIHTGDDQQGHGGGNEKSFHIVVWLLIQGFDGGLVSSLDGRRV